MKLAVLGPVYLDKRHIFELEALGKLVMYEGPGVFFKSAGGIKDADIIISAEAGVNGRIIRQCRHLKLICAASTGYDHIDIKTAGELGIAVTNTPEYAADAVAEHTFALTLAILRKLCEADRRMRAAWFDRKGLRGSQLTGKTFGVIGTGAAGSRVARIANCFGCDTVAFTLNPSLEREKRLGLKYLDLDALLKTSDVISLHIPLNNSTKGMIDRKEFALMRKKPVLINTSREGIIRYRALTEALSKGLISGVGLDTPPNSFFLRRYLLFKFRNIVFSPHTAFYTSEALNKCADTVVENIKSFIKGKPRNLVNKGRDALR